MSRFSIFRRRKQKSDTALDSSLVDDKSYAASARSGKTSRTDNNDSALPEKKRARRRLVGAITITLAAIIVLPMIFDSEPQTLPQELLLDIPSRDKPVTEHTRDRSVQQTPIPPPAAVESMPSPETEKVTTAPEKREPTVKPVDAATKEAGKTEEAKNRTSGLADSKPDTKTTVTADKKTNQKTETAKQANEDTKTNTKPASAKELDDPISKLIAENNSSKAKEAVSGKKYVIQVAALASQGKVNELQAKLKKQGLESYTQKVSLKDGSERIRVRIGPLSDSKEVSNTCAKLSQLKLPCTMVN